jgi:Flp pilus assembly pilin Flp
MTQIIRSMWNDEAGQDLVEYALLIALIAIVVATMIPALTDAINAVYNKIATCLGGGACA